MFTTIMTVRNTEPKVEIKSLEKSVAKEVAFDHPKAVNRFVSNAKLDTNSIKQLVIKC